MARCAALMSALVLCLPQFAPLRAHTHVRTPAPARTSPTGGGPASGVQADVVSNGIALSLLVPQRVFPRNSLVRVSVHVHNMSSQPVELSTLPQVSVLNGQGQNRYSASEGTYPPLPSNGPGGVSNGPALPVSLKPGRTLTQQVFVILHGRYLVASVGILKFHSSLEATTTMSTQPIAVRLIHGSPPRLSVIKNGIVVEAVIRPSSPAQRERLWYVALERCGSMVNGTVGWAIAGIWKGGAYHLSTDCLGKVTEWRIIAGWLNQPVVSLNYVA